MNTASKIKRILCYGDSLTFGKIPGSAKRYPPNERWTGILQQLLGDEYEIVEEGLRGRTTNLDDPDSVGRNGLTYFQSCILSHLPLDVVIIFLGTNDLKEKFNRSPSEIAKALSEYRASISFACKYLEEKEPAVLLVSPPLIDEVHTVAEWGYKGGEEKSKLLSEEYSKVSQQMSADFLDLASIVTPSDIDGIHVSVESNKKIATAIHQKLVAQVQT